MYGERTASGIAGGRSGVNVDVAALVYTSTAPERIDHNIIPRS
jgi:hypothetical protein